MTDTKHPQPPQSQRSSDFKYIPCDAINIAISDDGIKLILGVNEADAPSTDLVGVHMSHKTAMALKSIIARGLEHFQKETGKVIEDPDLKAGDTPDVDS